MKVCKPIIKSHLSTTDKTERETKASARNMKVRTGERREILIQIYDSEWKYHVLLTFIYFFPSSLLTFPADLFSSANPKIPYSTPLGSPTLPVCRYKDFIVTLFQGFFTSLSSIPPPLSTLDEVNLECTVWFSLINTTLCAFVLLFNIISFVDLNTLGFIIIILLTVVRNKNNIRVCHLLICEFYEHC